MSRSRSAGLVTAFTARAVGRPTIFLGELDAGEAGFAVVSGDRAATGLVGPVETVGTATGFEPPVERGAEESVGLPTLEETS